MHREHWRHRHCRDWEEFRKQNTLISHRKLQLIRAAERKSGKIWIFHLFFSLVYHWCVAPNGADLRGWTASLNLDFYFTDLTNLQFPQNLEIFLFHHFAKRMRGVTGIFRPSFFLFSTPPHTTQNFLPFCTTLRLAWTLENFPWTTTDFFFLHFTSEISRTLFVVAESDWFHRAVEIELRFLSQFWFTSIASSRSRLCSLDN